MIQTIKQILNERKSNLLLLRSIADTVGKEIESWNYQKLSKPSEDLSFSRQIDGIHVTFSLEAYEVNENGDIHICIDVDSKIPTFPYIKRPSYVFWKQRDGSVYY
jgi:hypothetical protein